MTDKVKNARYPSISTPNVKVAATQWMIERVLSAVYKLPPWFWNKKKCPQLASHTRYLNSYLYRVFGAALKRFPREDLMVKTVGGWTIKQRRKMLDIVRQGNEGKVIGTIVFYAQQELAREQRKNAPKYNGPVKDITIDIPEDTRGEREAVPSRPKSVWELLSGKE